MPHLVLDYADGLDQQHDFQALVEELFDVLASHPTVKGPETVRVRARPCRYSATGASRPGQVHATLHLLPGRDDATRREMAERVLATLEKRLPGVGSLSVDVADLDRAYLRRILQDETGRRTDAGRHNRENEKMDERIRIELEAAAFRRLRKHLMEDRTDVQNIDMMNLAGFCRNCLSRWYQEAAAERGIAMSKDEAREIFYGMPYAEWKAKYQTEASAEKQAEFEKAFAENVLKEKG